MRRVNLFLIILIASLISLIALIVVGMVVFSSAQQSPSSWMSGMWGGNMGGMMGGTSQPAVQNPALPFFGVAFVVLVGVAGMAYYVALPEIKTGAAPLVCEPVLQGNVEQEQKVACTPLESIVKTLS